MVWNAVGIPNQMSSIIERLRSMFSGRESADDRIRDAIEYAAMDIHDVCADVPHERIATAVYVLTYMIKTNVPADGRANALRLAMDQAACMLGIDAPPIGANIDVPQRWRDLRACMLSGQMTAAQIEDEMTADPDFAAWLPSEP